jgi:hypothetical protein
MKMKRSFLRIPVVMLIVMAAAFAFGQTPTITSISKITKQQFQTIVINGSGFGTQAPYTGDSNFISFGDVTRAWEGGYAPDGNAVGLIVNSWQDNQIVLGGFSGDWGGNGGQYVLAVGDKFTFLVFNAQTGGGPAIKHGRVVAQSTMTTLTSSPNPSSAGQPVTFIAVVSASGSVPPDGETVSFMSGTTLLGTGALSGGAADFTTSALPIGTTLVKAVYRGDHDLKGSKSNTVRQVVH